MKFCYSHFYKIQYKLCELGLGHLIPHSYEETLKKLKAKETSIIAYDPLLETQLKISTCAVQIKGQYMIEDHPMYGPYCPLCELEKEYAQDAVALLNGICNEAHWIAWQKYLVPTN